MTLEGLGIALTAVQDPHGDHSVLVSTGCAANAITLVKRLALLLSLLLRLPLSVGCVALAD